MDSDDDLYDEFGNFIGNPENSDAESMNQTTKQGNNKDEHSDSSMDEDEAPKELEETSMIKKEFSDTHTFETIVVDPTHQGDEQPIIKPIADQKLYIEYAKTVDSSDLPEVTYSRDYMKSLLKDIPERIRNFAIVGSLHTGKTSLVDRLVLETHPTIDEGKQNLQEFKSLRYLDSHRLEKERGISIGASLLTLLCPDSRDRSHVLNIIDCPGHPDFLDDTSAALSVVEGAVLVLDLLEGFTKKDKRIVTHLIKKNLPFVVVLNKFDRLILELRLPPREFFHKVRYVLDDINLFIHHNEFISTYTHEKLVSPLKNNVVFSSLILLTTFSLRSFSKLYCDNQQFAKDLDQKQLERLLWGEISFDENKKQFFVLNEDAVLDSKRTFEMFILDPLYKLVTYTLTSDGNGHRLSKLLWDNFKVTLQKSAYKKDPQILLKIVFGSVFGSTQALVDLITTALPGPEKNAECLLKRGLDLRDEYSSELVAEVFKTQLTSDTKGFVSFIRIHQGSLKEGQRVRIVGDNHIDDRKDDVICEVGEIYLAGGRYKVPYEEASAGSIVIVTGINEAIQKCATVLGQSIPKSLVKPIHWAESERRAVYKVAVEPEKPSELPRLVDGLKQLSRTYLSAVVRLEESGEHVILAPGELYMDCFLHDLRYLFDDYFSIKVSDPMVKFSETCAERSVTKIDTYASSKKSQISITSEPFNDTRVSQAIQEGKISLAQPSKVTSKTLRTEYGWDSLSARSLWCFGPDDMHNASILLDDSIDGETDKERLSKAKDLIITGFKLGINEGPLCNEPIRNCKFKILDAVLSGSKIQSSGSQIIPMTRNAVHTGFLTASPRLMEPVYRVSVTCTYNSIQAVLILLGKRRGWIVDEYPIPATKLYEIEGFVPVIDSVGLDTDMRLQTQGQAMCYLDFAKWDTVPGDPLDRDCHLPQMKPVPRQSMARDFVLKTRRRKGLSGEPNLQKYLDPELYLRLKNSGIIN